MKDEKFWEMLDCLVYSHEIVIERPKGTTHHQYADIHYELDYGYIVNSSSTDGEELDVWVGTDGDKKVTGIICTIDRLKTDVEIKILYGCREEEMQYIYNFHNKSDYMKGVLYRRFDIR